MARKRTLNYRELRSYDEEEGGEGRKKDRKAASARKPRPPRGHSMTAKRARPATAGATSR